MFVAVTQCRFGIPAMNAKRSGIKIANWGVRTAHYGEFHQFPSSVGLWLKIAAHTGIEFSPAMRTKARGTAALKPSPVRSAESHGPDPSLPAPLTVLTSCAYFHLIV